ncbi:MAG: hypothetical protein M0Q91_13210 [Methanoregula sp.]|jgi:hypothetical protein|nr:hypothetical protein [Methanoregula sp.]
MGISELMAGNWGSLILFIIPVFPLYFAYRMIADYLAERKRFPKTLRIKELEL